VVGIIVSLGIVGAGLWLTVSQNDAMMGAFGAMLLFLGATFLGVNLYLRHRGLRTRRRP
jgi:hypothetical protein